MPASRCASVVGVASFALAVLLACAAQATKGANLCELAPSGHVCEPLTYPGAASTRPGGIAHSGTVAGFGHSSGDRAFRYDAGSFSLLPDPPGASQTFAYGVNDAGHIVGYTLSNSGYRGFQWNGSAYTTLTVPGAAHTYAFGINNAGTVVGAWENALGVAAGFIYSAGSYTSFGLNGAVSTYAYGVADNGVVAGTYVSATGEIVGFTCSGSSTCVHVRAPGASSTYVRGINSFGDLVGEYVDSVGTHGFAILGSEFWSFSVAGAARTFIAGINDERQMVGYFDPGNQNYGGLLVLPEPIPLPGTIVLLASGLAAFGLLKRRLTFS